ncbi:MAG: PPC domain-containing protein, partial [Lachnospiraceae bacterium]|nr:PPC domain-containing protein [Lachnospiraceae bacterium]
MKKKLLSMLLILALTLGCLVTAGYKDVSAATFEEIFDQEISLNEYGSFQLNYEEATVFKFDLPADGSFTIDFAPKKIYANAELYGATGNKIGKTLGASYSSGSNDSFTWENLKAGTHYLRIWGHSKNSDRSGIEVAFYTRSVRSSDVVWTIGI